MAHCDIFRRLIQVAEDHGPRVVLTSTLVLDIGKRFGEAYAMLHERSIDHPDYEVRQRAQVWCDKVAEMTLLLPRQEE